MNAGESNGIFPHDARNVKGGGIAFLLIFRCFSFEGGVFVADVFTIWWGGRG